jgi:hypothetical protein
LGFGATTTLNTGDFAARNFLTTAKANANPFVGAGVEFSRFRSIVTYQIPVYGGTEAPNQLKFGLNNELALTRHIRVIVPVSVNSYNTGYRITVTQVGAGIKIVL